MHQRHSRGANTIRPTYLRLLSTVKARRIIATLQLAVLALFVSAEQFLSYLRFPTPRLQTDDGYQEITDMHAREDLLLENYSWADQGKGTVRIPIERAMELLAQRGLQVVPQTTETQAPVLAEDNAPVVKAPLTDGFARTGYEQDQIAKEAGFKERGKE